MSFEARALTRVIDGRVLFEGLSFSLAPGEILAVRGPSGSGKTTLLRLLAWLEPPDGGAVLLDGRGPVDCGVPEWRAQVAYVAQRPPIYAGTPGETLAYARSLRAHTGGGDPVALAAGWGLPTQAWGTPWSRLSGGEAQRAALALTLSREPAVLLLDEPTSGLDAEAVRGVEASLAGRRAVLVTHDAAQVARLAGRTLAIGGATG